MEEEMSLITVNERNHSWVVEIDDRISTMGDIPKAKLIKKKSSIYRRPVNVREKQDTFLYTPRIVSFGPYHHMSCEQTNKSMELVLMHCLKKSGKKVKDYLKALEVQDLKDAYDELDSHWQENNDAFMKLMIFDGCFFLEILREAESLDDLGHLSSQLLAMFGISRNELKEYYKHDMLLLENQLPMKLLVQLFAVQKDLQFQAAKEDLYKRILGFLSPSSTNIAEKLLKQAGEHMHLHVLDLYRRSLLYDQEHRVGTTLQNSDKITSNGPVDDIFYVENETSCDGLVNCCTFIIAIPLAIIVFPIAFIGGLILGIILCPLQVLRYLCWSKPATDIDFIIPSATELDKVGIGVDINETKSLKDVSFGSRTFSFGSRTLRLPEIYVDAATQSRFLNIIAFEQLHADHDNEVTSYIYFMSRLLKVAGDVRLLQLRGIIRTPLHNDQVAELFKSLTKDIVHDPKIFLVKKYRNVGKRVTESFYSKMNNPWQRDLRQTHLKSPWAVISVIAAFFLFTLTSIQTVYTVFSYYNPK